MSDNPYTPPAAEVADPPPVRLIRPRAVDIALVLLILNLGVFLLLWLREWQEIDFRIGSAPIFAGQVFDKIVYAVLIYQIAQGRRWARLVLLLLVLFSFVMECYAIGKWRIVQEQPELLLTPVFLFKNVLPIVVNFVALHLLYITGGSWFRERQAA